MQYKYYIKSLDLSIFFGENLLFINFNKYYIIFMRILKYKKYVLMWKNIIKYSIILKAKGRCKKVKKIKINQQNKVLWVLLAILIVCFIIIGIIFYTYFYAGTSSSKYGDRLDGIENYPLNKKIDEEIKALYKDESSVNKVVYELQGKIIYITIDFKESIKVSDAETLAIKSLETIGEKNLSFYEIQYILTYSGTEENANYPVFGSKNANSLKVVWSK